MLDFLIPTLYLAAIASKLQTAAFVAWIIAIVWVLRIVTVATSITPPSKALVRNFRFAALF